MKIKFGGDFMSACFSYYELQLKLIREMLGTCPSTDIYAEHILSKSKKLIVQANKTQGKLRKNLQKYLGTEILPEKEIQELQGIIQTYSEILGESFDLPDDLESLLLLSQEINERVNDLINRGDEMKATVFMRDEDGHPIISSHLILGNVKEILRTIVNSGDKFCFKSKVQLNECAALDLKVIEPFIRPSKDILREEGTDKHKLDIRPIRFEIMGKPTTALSASEVLPIGTILSCNLRIRKGSPLDCLDTLKKIFSHGKNLGLGQWRSSGNRGAYVFKLKELKDFKEDFGEWE
jgi:hypothetical protein